MESEETDETTVSALYDVMNKEVEEYLGHLNSTIPISILYHCNYVEVSTNGIMVGIIQHSYL